MKKQHSSWLLRSKSVLAAPLLLCTMVFAGCPYYDWDDYEYPATVPKLMSKQDLAKSVKSSAPRDLVKPGKIYTKDNLLFVNEKYEGVHVIDNTDPSNPRKISFIEVPGCIDIAMKGNTLYVDNSIDLVAINIADPSNVVVTERITGIFPELINQDADFNSMQFDRKQFVIVGWRETMIKGGSYAE